MCASPQSGVPLVRSRAPSIPHESANEAVGSNKTHESRRRLTECLCSAECGSLLCELSLGTKFLVVCANPQSGAPMVRGLF
jgi:hypothetical protein